VGQRLVRQRLSGLQRVAGRHRPVAGADRDHARRQRVEPAPLAPPRQVVAQDGRTRPDLAHDRPDENDRGGERGQHDGGPEHAGLDHVVLPIDEQRARPVGEPSQARCQHEHDDQEQDETHHRTGSPLFRSLPAAAAGISD